MLGRAAALPGECRIGWDLGRQWHLPAAFGRSEKLLVLGMGGSAIGADLLEGIARADLAKPIFANRTYDLPRWVDRKTGVLVCSYSGNTEETLSAAAEARRRGARLAAITSGGKLARWAGRHGVALVRIPSGLPPRTALGYLAFIPLGALVGLGWVRPENLPVEAALRGLERFVKERLDVSVRRSANPAKRAAERLQGTLPILYGAAGGWEGVVYRWKTQLEENAKTLAFHHIFPEATHNEISGWVEPKGLMRKLTAVFLLDPAVHPRTRRRMTFSERVVRRQGARVLKLSVSGRSRLERILRLVSLGDFVSVYLGLLHRQDPTPVVRVEALKKYMGSDSPGRTSDFRGLTP